MVKKDLLNFQKKLYEEALLEVSYHLNRQPKAIANYQETFNKSLPRKASPSSMDELLDRVAPGQTILFGDFHTLASSQRAVLRFINLIKFYKPDLELQLGIEFFRTEHSSLLQRFLSDQVSEEELLEKCDYSNTWGFPWKNYRQLLVTAKELDIPVFAFNQKRGKSASMKSRDLKIAKKCVEARGSDPSIVQLIVIGEHHLAPSHLPAALIKLGCEAGKLLRVFSNIDEYYFQLHKRKIEPHTEVMRVDPMTYCVLNSAPWIKWKSLTIWVESSKKSDICDEEDEEHFNEFEYDSDHLFLNMASQFVNFLGIILDKKEIENFNLTKTSDITEPINELNSSLTLSRRLNVELISESFKRKGYLYIPELRSLFLVDDNPHHLAELVGHHIFSCLYIDKSGSNFISSVLRYAMGAISSKIYAPTKIMMTKEDHHKFLIKNRRPTTSTLIKRKRISARSTLKFSELLSSKGNSLPRSVLLANHVTKGEVSKSIGIAIGLMIYSNYLASPQYREKLKNTLQRMATNSDPLDLEFIREMIINQRPSSSHDAA